MFGLTFGLPSRRRNGPNFINVVSRIPCAWHRWYKPFWQDSGVSCRRRTHFCRLVGEWTSLGPSERRRWVCVAAEKEAGCPRSCPYRQR